MFLAVTVTFMATYFIEPEVMKEPGDAAGWAAAGMMYAGLALGMLLDWLTD
jgi:hypothetical protein